MLKRAEIYPDSADSGDRITFAYNRQGQVREKKDQNGTVHTIDFDKVGRKLHDRVTMLGEWYFREWPRGIVGRHAMAFFFGTVGCAFMIIVLNYRDSVARLIRDIPEGLGAGVLIYSMLIAGSIEFISWVHSCCRAR